MFKAIVGASTFQDALDSVSVLVDECKIRLNEEELSIRAVDPANVGMVDLTLEAAAFESYEADGGVIGVNLARLEDIAGMANSGDLIHLELDEETRKLHIEIDGLSYTLALIDPDSIRQEPDIPDLDLAAEIVVEGAQIDRGIKAADMVSDHIRLRVDETDEAFFIEAEGDTDDVDLELTREDLIALTAGPADSLFSLDYLKDMNKARRRRGHHRTRRGVPRQAPLRLRGGARARNVYASPSHSERLRRRTGQSRTVENSSFSLPIVRFRSRSHDSVTTGIDTRTRVPRGSRSA